MLKASIRSLVKELSNTDPKVWKILKNAHNIKEARERLFSYFNDTERELYNVFSKKETKYLHPIERNNAKHCVRVLKNTIRTEYELTTGFSALKQLISIAKGRKKGVSPGFLCEFIALFQGMDGKSGIYARDPPEFLRLEGKDAAFSRSEFLDTYSGMVEKRFLRFGSGLEPKFIAQRKIMKRRIMKYFGATERQWKDYEWHIRNAINDLKTVKKLVSLGKEEEKGIMLAKKWGVLFQITPYYLSLFMPDNPKRHGRAIRAQVIPSPYYCKGFIRAVQSNESLDFMDEGSTSPASCITRRYLRIVILKPYDSCPQFCVYCQRNWEIKARSEAYVSDKRILQGIEWIKRHNGIKEVLVTGGDPFMLSDERIDKILGELAKIKHIIRLRIGTRTLVTVPFRITPKLVSILKKYHKLPKREVCIVTHVEHPTELTPDVFDACKKLRKAGISIYNQQVFTYYNSKRFETCALRKELKKCGIDPYYSFNTKGKEETNDFRVPIARLLQERKEEARLMPGLERTDEPVFNVPRLGKSHLRSWQEHGLISILPDGKRVYRFYPWESKLELVQPYDYTDVSIYDYLKRLQKDGEDVNEYRAIWYYF